MKSLYQDVCKVVVTAEASAAATKPPETTVAQAPAAAATIRMSPSSPSLASPSKPPGKAARSETIGVVSDGAERNGVRQPIRGAPGPYREEGLVRDLEAHSAPGVVKDATKLDCELAFASANVCTLQ